MPNAIKEKAVQELTEDIKSSSHILVTEYQGMSATEFDELRASLRNLGSKYKVVKNRLAKISLDTVGAGDLAKFMKGPSAIAYLGQDSAGIAKALFKFGEQHTNLKVKAARIFGMTVDAKGLREISNLPSREVLLATLLARLNGPLTSLAGILNEPLRSLHSALSAVAKKKEAAA